MSQETHPENASHPEDSYLNLIKDVLENGEERNDRTGTGTLSVFGRTLRFSASPNNFPLYTTKRTFFRGVVEELLWILRGETDAKILHNKGVKIWDGNSCADNSKYPEYDCGPIYGWQLRRFNKRYNFNNDYGIDQLRYVIDLILNDPHSRRIMWNLWNPEQLKDMCLPPCHYSYQFYINGENNQNISLLMNMRSNDIGCGNPFNIASGALLLNILAHFCGKKPKELILVIGDAHIYKNHVDGLKEQMSRKPYPFPSLKIKKPVRQNITTDSVIEDIENLKYEDFELENYKCHPSIKLKMAV